MTINLELPKKFDMLVAQSHQAAAEIFRPNSRKYDTAEHEYPKELDMLAALIDGMSESGAMGGAGAGTVGGGPGAAAPNGSATNGSATNANGSTKAPKDDGRTRNGGNMASLLGLIELCWGDVGLLLSMPRQGLGQAAIGAVADEEQLKRFGGKWAAMAITEPEAGSDSAAIRTTAKYDEASGEYILNGEKIYVTSGDRAELIVVWATLDRSKGRGAIKSFVVERDNPGLKLDRLEHKLGIRASDTANFFLTDCRVPKENLLGDPEIQESRQGFAGVMKTFDNTRPMVAGMAVGVARACLERTRELLAEAGVEIDYDAPSHLQTAAASEFIAMEADWEAARLLTLQAAWMADNKRPNSLEASMAKAKAGRMGTDVALRCVALCGATGYAETELLEKWARDAKILDLFEGTQQIQLLIIARQLLGKSSSELK
jgi:acyl-CoA dehydrogenase